MFRKRDPPRKRPEDQPIEFPKIRKTAWDNLLEEARLHGLPGLLHFYSEVIATVLDEYWDQPIPVQRRALEAVCPLSREERKGNVCGDLWRKEIQRQRRKRNRADREWRLSGRNGAKPSVLRTESRLPIDPADAPYEDQPPRYIDQETPE